MVCTRSGAPMRTNCFGVARVVVVMLCAFLSVSLWGQTSDSGKASASPAAADGNTYAKPHDARYVTETSDTLAINEWKEPDVSRTVPLRSDGKISLPLAGEIQ